MTGIVSYGQRSCLEHDQYKNCFASICGFEGTSSYGPVAKLVIAPPCHGGGRRFESDLGRFSWDLSSAGRASALQAGGHRFESGRSQFFIRSLFVFGLISVYADVAQLAEQLICNQQVNGSSPLIGFGSKLCQYCFDLLDGFPSGQRGQTVNLLSTTSKVRILPHPFSPVTDATSYRGVEQSGSSSGS